MHKMKLRDFLKWAFGEELVHVATDGGSLAWSRLADYATLGTVIDTFGIGGAGLPDLADVHPDAIAANDAVMLLAAERFDLPDGWNPFPDMDDPHGLIAGCVQAVLDRRSRLDPGALNNNLIAMVIAYAVMGRDPDWTAEQPKFRMVTRAGRPAWFVTAEHIDSFGQVHTYEADGYNARTGRPKRGAYRKFEMSDGFEGAVQARIDWYLWTLALERIAARLREGLKSHRIEPFVIDREPWRAADHPAASSQVSEIAAK